MNNRELLNTYNSSIDMPSDRVFITNNVPIINENDAVTTREVRFGDNDRLASYVAQMVGADILILILIMTFNYKRTLTMP